MSLQSIRVELEMKRALLNVFFEMEKHGDNNAHTRDPVPAILLWGPKVLLAVGEIGKYDDSPLPTDVIVHMAYIKALLARSESIRHSRICLNNL